MADALLRGSSWSSSSGSSDPHASAADASTDGSSTPPMPCAVAPRPSPRRRRETRALEIDMALPGAPRRAASPALTPAKTPARVPGAASVGSAPAEARAKRTAPAGSRENGSIDVDIVDGFEFRSQASNLSVEPAVKMKRPRGKRRAPRAPARELPAAAEFVPEEAEGLRLHLSSSSATGYKGVSKGEGGNLGRFRAQTYTGGESSHLGFFDTAVDAAVAYARSVGAKRQKCVLPGREQQLQQRDPQQLQEGDPPLLERASLQARRPSATSAHIAAAPATHPHPRRAWPATV